MIKQTDWKEPTKFLGHGKANSRQKSTLLNYPVGDLASVANAAKKVRLFCLFVFVFYKTCENLKDFLF
jgi:hypothetical protein